MRQGYRNYSVFGYRPVQASGGFTYDILVDGRPYRVHRFINTGTSSFTVHNVGNDPTVEYLIVGGGGSGAQRHNGGGGGGGVISGTVSVSAQSYNVSVGAGGPGLAQTVLPSIGTPSNGQSSSVFGITALGGGAGAGGSGGSGGGGNATASGGLGTSGQGNSGGSGSLGPFSNESSYAGGGGGGAGSAGSNATSSTPAMAGNGGDGISSSITGNLQFYGAGGGGGVASTGTAGASGQGGSGGIGGGGNGGRSFGAGSGANQTGSGGGGGGFSGSTNFPAGRGGSGVVVVRYPIAPLVPAEGIVATGGIVSDISVDGVSYRTHTFTQSGTLSISRLGNLGNEIECLTVGGGGGGAAGGGGAGGVNTKTIIPSTSTEDLYVTVGNGGSLGSESTRGQNGGPSLVFLDKKRYVENSWINHNNGFTTRLIVDIYKLADNNAFNVQYGVAYTYYLQAQTSTFSNQSISGYIKIGGQTVWTPSGSYSIGMGQTIILANGLFTTTASKTSILNINVAASSNTNIAPNGYTAGEISITRQMIFQESVVGGGGGGGHSNGDDAAGEVNGRDGASGGGGGMNMNSTGFGGSGISGQGFAGGNADYTGNAEDTGGGAGGGGAGGPGQSYAQGGGGGLPFESSIGGSLVQYAYGGGYSTPSIANTGSGGAPYSTGKNGIVIFRYRIP